MNLTKSLLKKSQEHAQELQDELNNLRTTSEEQQTRDAGRIKELEDLLLAAQNEMKGL